MSERNIADQVPFHERVTRGDFLVFYNGKKIDGDEIKSRLTPTNEYVTAPIPFHAATRNEGSCLFLTPEEIEKHGDSIGAAAASKIIISMEIGGPITRLIVLNQMEYGIAALPKEHHDDYNSFWNTTKHTKPLTELRDRLNKLVLEPTNKRDN